MSSNIDEQIEKIADEADTDRFSVIVQMESKEKLTEYLEAISEAMSQRRSMVSARDMAIPKKSDLSRKGGLTPSGQKRFSADATSSAKSLIAFLMLDVVAAAMLKQLGLDALQPLFQSPLVRSLVEKSTSSSGTGKGTESKPVHFWTSASAILKVTKDELKTLRSEVSNVSAVYPNRTVRIPPISKAQGLPHIVEDNKAYTWGLSRTGAMACWGAFETRGSGVKVAILDTGFDPSHPDLANKLAGFAEFDHNGNLATEDIKDANDSGGHGTHCAGVVVGGDKSGRWIGMAPDAHILSAQVLKNGFGTDAQILGGLQWAITNKADVISMSLGGLRLSADVLDTYTRTIINANRLGIPVVVSVGNDGSQTTGSPGNDYFAFTVGATDGDDRPAGFSGGRTQIIEKSQYIDAKFLPVVYSKPELTAPGVEIYSSVPGGKWEAWNGTSMATPHVAGAMALMLSKPCTIRELVGLNRVHVLQTALTSTVRELGEAGQDHRYGYGRVDVLRAMGYAKAEGYWS